MVTKSIDVTREIYGISPVPIDPDDMPDRIPIEMIQGPTIDQIAIFLKNHLGPIANLLMLSNIPIRYDTENRRIFVAPDYFLSFDVDVSAIRDETSYNMWEIGKPPEWALEVASPSTYQRDIYEKPYIYADIGISEYWLFDPTGGSLYGQPLTGFRLVNGTYEPIEIAPNEHGLDSGYSDVIEARLCALERPNQSELERIQPNFVLEEDHYPAQLLLQDPRTGLYILNDRGVRLEYERTEMERRQAEMERRQAEDERQQAEDERRKAEDGWQQADKQRDEAIARAEEAEAEIVRLRAQIQRLEQD